MGPAAGRLVVLLTDGRSNAGSVPTDVAAALAAFHRIRVHTVGIGSRGEVAMAGGARGRELDFERHDLDAAAGEIARRQAAVSSTRSPRDCAASTTRSTS
jgi:hypothetical protein